MKLSWVLIFINIIALVLAILWWYFTRDFEPIITALGLFGALIIQLFVKENKNGKLSMKQKSGNYSTNFQIGGNFNSKSENEPETE